MTKKKIVTRFVELVSGAKPEELAELNVTTGARRLGITPSQLCHAFKTHYICSAGDFVSINKQIAFEELIDSRKARNLKEALKILDIRSASNFIEKYKAFRQQTPHETIWFLKLQMNSEEKYLRKLSKEQSTHEQ